MATPTHLNLARPTATRYPSPPKVLSLAIGLVPLCHNLGSSHLLGVFLAGFCFCTADLVHAAWSKQVRRKA